MMPVVEGAPTAIEVRELEATWGRAGAVRFVASPLGGPVAELLASGGRATVAILGAQVLSYVPSGERDALWVSDLARLDSGKPLRGGVPVCWPWFGRHADPAKPAHGFVRTLPWRVIAASGGEGRAAISLAIETRPEHAGLWPHDAAARIDVALTRERLQIDLTTVNTGSTTFPLTQALHSYFAISDAGAAMISGLSGRSYRDHVGPLTRRSQSGDIPVDREINRVYDESEDTVVIQDSGLARRIVVGKAGSRATVVWNPWIEMSERLGDMGAAGYRRMICVETANAGEDVVSLAPGARHTLTQAIAVERMPER